MIAILSTLLFAAAGLTAASVILASLHGCRDDVRALRVLVRAYAAAHASAMQADLLVRAVRPASERVTMPQPAFATWPSLAA